MSWAGDVSVVPVRHYRPQTLKDLVDLVREAECRRPPAQVHASGSRWAFSAPGASTGFAVETAELSSTLDTQVVKTLAPDTAPNRWGTEWLGAYHVQAGVLVHDLCLRLDGRGRPQPRPVVVSGPAERGRPEPARWALPTMGDSSGQTLLGAVSTSSHGMDVRLPPTADCVRALHLVGPGGRQHWIERTVGITKPDALEAEYPGIEVHYDDDLLAAAVVSLGRFGIVYSALIDVVPQFGLRSTTTAADWATTAEQLRTGEVLQRHRAVQVVVSPYATAGRRASYVTARDLTGSTPPVASQTLGRVMSAFVNDGGTLLRALRASLVVLSAGQALNLLLWLSPVVGWTLLVLQVLVLLGLVNGLGRPGDVVGRLCAWANRHGRWTITAGLVRRVLASAQRSRTVTGVGFQVSAGAPWVDEYYRGRSVELFFDATTPDYLATVTDHLLPLIEGAAQEGHAIVGWFSLRFTGAGRALLAMQQWERTVSVEVAVLRGVPGSVEVLRRLHACALARGGRVHWGQHNELSPQQVAAAYPALARWRRHLCSLSRTDAEEQTFENEFCRARGLTGLPHCGSARR